MTPMVMPPMPPPKKKGLSGCLIALLVVGGLAFVCCAVAGALLYRASQSEDGKKFTTALGKGISLATKGMNAPGTAELRALGCGQAFVLEGQDVMGVVELFVDAGAEGDRLDDTFVMCQGNVLDSLPSCDAVAETYVKAGKPTHPFTVTVQQQGRQREACMRQYDASGAFLKDVSPSRKR